MTNAKPHISQRVAAIAGVSLLLLAGSLIPTAASANDAPNLDYVAVRSTPTPTPLAYLLPNHR
jgi:hypothetical protein